MPSAASASRKMPTNSRRMSLWRGSGIPISTRCANGLIEHALSTSSEFTVDAFCLYSSKLTSDGSVYRVEQEYPLRGFHGEIDD